MTSRDLPRPPTISPQVAGLIKKFFRELAIPLCPYEMYAELLGLAESLSADLVMLSISTRLWAVIPENRCYIGYFHGLLKVLHAVLEVRPDDRCSSFWTKS